MRRFIEPINGKLEKKIKKFSYLYRKFYFLKMMGFSILNKILKFDIDHKWLKFINDNGYLSCIINTISDTDNQLLEELFHSESNNDKIIYIFESKLAFLLSISTSVQGSQCLLKNDLITKLIACSIFSQRKNFEKLDSFLFYYLFNN